MSNDDLSSELLSFQLSDSDGEDADANANADSGIGAGSGAGAEPDRAARTVQSEEAFQAVKRSYRVKVENGKIWRTIKLPLPTDVAVTKPEAQALLHAVEELYFFRRYAEGAAFVRRVLGGNNSAGTTVDEDRGGDEDGEGPAPAPAPAPALDEDTRKTLRYYEMRCTERQGQELELELEKRGEVRGVMTADADTNIVT